MLDDRKFYYDVTNKVVEASNAGQRGLPATAFSVRVGPDNPAARHYLSNHNAVRRMLREMTIQNQPQAIP